MTQNKVEAEFYDQLFALLSEEKHQPNLKMNERINKKRAMLRSKDSSIQDEAKAQFYDALLAVFSQTTRQPE